MRFTRSIFSGLLAMLVVDSAAARAGTTLNEGIWDDRWLGGYGNWLPLVLAVVVCFTFWMARKKQKK